jgi:nucleoside-diphosphate-sugar epimerase
MRKLLITGANSYIGISVENWLKRWPDKYQVDTLDMLDNKWREKSFCGYDIIFHVAGIAHVSTNPNMEELYYKVNRDLTIETANKAREDKISQFIFMSSGIVYGDSSSFGEPMLITSNTVPEPANFYGKSKLQAEEGIRNLENDKFRVVILRPPMIYGTGCKGNYNKLSSYGRKLPIFPKVENCRSMLYIDNLCEFVRLMIDNNESGIFFPQNEDYFSTSDIVKYIAHAQGRKIVFTRFFNPLLKLLSKRFHIISKAFGSFAYDKSISKYKQNYHVVNSIDSINIIEKV